MLICVCCAFLSLKCTCTFVRQACSGAYELRGYALSSAIMSACLVSGVLLLGTLCQARLVGALSWSFPPPNLFTLQEVPCVSAGMLRVIVLLKSMPVRKHRCYRWQWRSTSKFAVSYGHHYSSKYYKLCSTTNRYTSPYVDFERMLWFRLQYPRLSDLAEAWLRITVELYSALIAKDDILERLLIRNHLLTPLFPQFFICFPYHVAIHRARFKTT